MEKLTAFLEEEREKFNLQFCENYDWWITDEEPEAKPSLVKEWLKDHDTRLINHVLDTVMEEIEKESKNSEFRKEKVIGRTDGGETIYDTQDFISTKQISTIINKLKVK